MSDKPFFYQDPFPLGPDTTEYECISTEYVSTAEFEGKPVLRITPDALTLLAAEAIKAINFTLRPAHLAQVAAILDDPDASENDRMVALSCADAQRAPRGKTPDVRRSRPGSRTAAWSDHSGARGSRRPA
jgi:fumarate hydratase class I